jgi:hypothetical protein
MTRFAAPSPCKLLLFLRSVCILLLASELVISPCLAQSAEQMAPFAAIETQNRLRQVQSAQEELAKAQAAGQTIQMVQIAMELASLYQTSNTYSGNPLDLAKAREWYVYGASRGNSVWSAYCAYSLGTMYWDGRGGPQDKERAKYIWMWAAENGDRDAIVQLEKLGFDMRKERALAFDKAKAQQSQRPQQPPQVRSQQGRAEEGLAILFGLWLAATVAKNYECQSQRQAQIMGGGTPSSDTCR